MQLWVNLKKSAVMLHKFFNKAKHFIGIHCLKADAKQELLSITMQYMKVAVRFEAASLVKSS